jgi:hypothetical protein
MTKKTQNEINKVLKAGLPAMVAGELKERLEQADHFEDLCETLSKSNVALNNQVKDLRLQVKDYGDLESLEQELNARLSSADTREVRLIQREEILRLREEHAAEKVILMKDNFDTVFRNTTVRTKALEMKADTYPTPDGCGGTIASTTHVPYDVVSETEEK